MSFIVSTDILTVLRRFWFKPLIVVLALATTLPTKAQVDAKLIKQLDADLCASKAPDSPQPDGESDAGFCPECIATGISTAPKKIPTDALTALEQHELEYLKQKVAARSNEPKVRLKALKSELDQISAELKNKQAYMTTLNQLIDGLTQLSDEPLTHEQKILAFEITENGKNLIQSRINHLGNRLQVLENPGLYAYPGFFVSPKEVEDIKASLSKEESRGDKLNMIVPRFKSEKFDLNSEERQLLSDLTKAQLNSAQSRIDRLQQNQDFGSKEADKLQAQIAAVDKELEATGTGDKRTVLKKLQTQFSILGVLKMNPTFKDCGLSTGEILALKGYTQADFRPLNRAMYSEGDLSKFESQILLIRSALAKIRPYQGLVNRGVTFPDEVLARHQPGQIVDYKAFSSTSLGRGFGGRHRLSIRSKTGRYIAPYSGHYGEAEVLFPPTKLKVLSREDQPDGVVNIVLEEVE